MVAPLARVMLCGPEAAGWSDSPRAARWRELGHQEAPDFGAARAEHDVLRRELEASGAEVLWLGDSDSLSLDAVYCHDASFPTDYGVILLRMGKPGRVPEARHHGELYKSLGIPLLGEVQPPGTAEAGDLLWLDGSTLLVGRGYRTNAAGIEQIRSLLSPWGVEVMAAPLPHGSGPEGCLHLMSLVSLLDEHTALVDPAWLAVETVELLRGRGFRLIEIAAAERDQLACNVLAVGLGRVLGLEENAKTNALLRQHGFEVRTFPGRAIAIQGRGGPTCLTRPVLRG